MQIAAIGHAIPRHLISNQWMLDELRARNSHLGARELSRIGQQAAAFLAAAGTRERYHLAEDETTLGLVERAANATLTRAGIARRDVEFVIVASVARGWLEPSTATVVLQSLSLERATCFDILDACMGWLRAMHVADAFFRAGQYRCGLIVNAECGMVRTHIESALTWDEAFSDRLAGLTVGEGVTATVVTAGAGDFHFVFESFPDYLDLCMLPLGGVADFYPPALGNPMYERGRFFAKSRRLVGTATKKLLEAYRADPRLSAGPYDIAFGHNASARASQLLARRMGRSEIFFPTHERFGNTASAAIPLGMSVALDEGKLRRGDRVLAVVGSAGISIGFGAFTF